MREVTDVLTSAETYKAAGGAFVASWIAPKATSWAISRFPNVNVWVLIAAHFLVGIVSLLPRIEGWRTAQWTWSAVWLATAFRGVWDQLVG